MLYLAKPVMTERPVDVSPTQPNASALTCPLLLIDLYLFLAA